MVEKRPPRYGRRSSRRTDRPALSIARLARSPPSPPPTTMASYDDRFTPDALTAGLGSFGSIGARNFEIRFAAVVSHAEPPWVAAHLAILDEAAARFWFDV